MLDKTLTVQDLSQSLATAHWPQIVDVRKAPAFAQDPRRLPTARRALPDAVETWAHHLSRQEPVLVHCVHGHEVGRDTAKALRDRGYDAAYLAGGFTAWLDADLPLLTVAWPVAEIGSAPSSWVTRARPKIDRLACPWLIRRFIDPQAVIHYVPTAEVRDFAKTQGATPFDIADVAFSHVEEACSFDAFLRLSGLSSPALTRLAAIVRAADTDHLEQAPQAAGLLALSLGLGYLEQDDQRLLAQAMTLYDALYAWCLREEPEVHGWRPEAT